MLNGCIYKLLFTKGIKACLRLFLSSMNKKLLAVALTFLMAGILISSYSNTRVERVKWETLGSRIFSQNDSDVLSQPWIAYCKENVTAGDKIIVDITPGTNWYQFKHGIPEDPYNMKYFSINVSIIDPFNNRTWFEITYVAPGEALLPWRIKLLSNDGALIVNTTKNGIAPEIGGTAERSGNYSVLVPQVYPSPPREIKIMKEIRYYIKPWNYLLPIGLSMTCGGAVLAGFSFRKKKTIKK